VLFINMSRDLIEFVMPEADALEPWQRLVDTADWAEPHGNWFEPEDAEVLGAGSRYGVHGLSIAVFKQVRH